jgi:hypothetical protein
MAALKTYGKRSKTWNTTLDISNKPTRAVSRVTISSDRCHNATPIEDTIRGADPMTSSSHFLRAERLWCATAFLVVIIRSKLLVAVAHSLFARANTDRTVSVQ